MSAHALSSEYHPMASHIFDTLAYAKKLKSAGVPETQAEIHAEAIAEIMDEKLATKKDLSDLEERLTYKMTIRVGSMIIAAVTVLAILIKIL